MDIAVLSETKKKGEGNKYKDDYLYFWSGVEKSKRAKAGVAIAIKKKLETNIIDWYPLDERIIIVDIRIRGRVIKVIGIYAPTDNADTNVKTTFFDKLSEELLKVKNRQEIILLGDLNGRVGNALDSKIIGRHGEDVVNDNGERWIELCEQHSLKILNGFFQHRDINKYTWVQKTKNLKSIIDYIIIKQNSTIKPHDVKVWRGAECGTDHLLVKSPLEIKYHNQIKVNRESRSCIKPKYYNIDSLKDESTSFLYKLRLANKLEKNMVGTAEEIYETLKNTVHEAAYEALGYKEKLPKNFWWKEGLTKLTEQKKKLYLKWLNTKDTEYRKQYNRYKYLVKKMIIETKNKAWDMKCAEVNSKIGGSRAREAWNTINKVRKKSSEKRKINPIKINEWEKYYKNLLTEHRTEYQDLGLHSEVLNETHPKMEPITEEEVKIALQNMKNNKSPGPGDLPIELLKHATSRALELMCIIFNKCLEGEDIPTDWKISYINSIYKKGSRKECGNYRGISITSSIGKLYERILKNRIEREIEEIEEQSGFRPGRSCVDNIFTIRQLAEKRITKGMDLHVTFIDLRKAFDSVPLQKLWQSMEEVGISKIYINAVKSLYRENQTRVRTADQISIPFSQTKGVKQGCCLSPTLFKVYVQVALKNWAKKCSPMGIQLSDRPIYTILFADDQIVVAEDELDMTYMLNKLIEEYSKWGLEVNTEKTQYMVIGGEGQDLQIEQGTIKHVKEYEYLGVTISEDGRDNKDIMKKIGKGKNIIKALHPLLWNKNLNKKTKKNIYNSMVEPVLTYGSEVWVLSQSTKQKLISAEMTYWRRCCGVTLLDHVRNSYIRSRMDAEATIIDTINEKQLKWYGHLRRMKRERIPLKIWNWTPARRNKRGRPRKKWMKNVREVMEDKGLQEEDWKDRKKWLLGCEKRH